MPARRINATTLLATGVLLLGPISVSAQAPTGRGIKPHTGDEAGTLTPRPSKPLSGLRLTLVGGNGSAVQSAETDSAGRFTFSNVPAGTYRLHKENIVHRDLAARDGAIAGIVVAAVISAVRGAQSSAPEAGSGDVRVVAAQLTTITGQVSVDAGPIKGAVISTGHPTAKPPQ